MRKGGQFQAFWNYWNSTYTYYKLFLYVIFNCIKLIFLISYCGICGLYFYCFVLIIVFFFLIEWDEWTSTPTCILWHVYYYAHYDYRDVGKVCTEYNYLIDKKKNDIFLFNSISVIICLSARSLKVIHKTVINHRVVVTICALLLSTFLCHLSWCSISLFD